MLFSWNILSYNHLYQTFEINYKNMGLVKNDPKLSVHHVKFQFIGDFLNDYIMEKTFIDIHVVWIQSDASYRRTKVYAKNNNTQMWWTGFFPSSVKEHVMYAVERHLEPHCEVKSWGWMPLPTHFFSFFFFLDGQEAARAVYQE